MNRRDVLKTIPILALAPLEFKLPKETSELIPISITSDLHFEYVFLKGRNELASFLSFPTEYTLLVKYPLLEFYWKSFNIIPPSEFQNNNSYNSWDENKHKQAIDKYVANLDKKFIYEQHNDLFDLTYQRLCTQNEIPTMTLNNHKWTLSHITLTGEPNETFEEAFRKNNQKARHD